MDLYELIEILEESVKKNGPDKVLTLGHLLNILKLVVKRQEEEEEFLDAMDGFPDMFD